jgi:hypothetical protein
MASAKDKKMANAKIAVYFATNISFDAFKLSVAYAYLSVMPALIQSSIAGLMTDDEEEKEKLKIVNEKLKSRIFYAQNRKAQDIAISVGIDAFVNTFPTLINVTAGDLAKNKSKAMLLSDKGSQREQVASELMKQSFTDNKTIQKSILKTMYGQNAKPFDGRDAFDQSVFQRASNLVENVEKFDKLDATSQVNAVAEFIELIFPPADAMSKISGYSDYAKAYDDTQLRMIEDIEKENTVGQKRFEYGKDDEVSKELMSKEIIKGVDNIQRVKELTLIMMNGRTAKEGEITAYIYMPKGIKNPRTGKDFSTEIPRSSLAQLYEPIKKYLEKK